MAESAHQKHQTQKAQQQTAHTISGRDYARILVPFVLSTMTQPLLGVVDTAIMGHMSDSPTLPAWQWER